MPDVILQLVYWGCCTGEVCIVQWMGQVRSKAQLAISCEHEGVIEFWGVSISNYMGQVLQDLSLTQVDEGINAHQLTQSMFISKCSPSMGSNHLRHTRIFHRLWRRSKHNKTYTIPFVSTCSNQIQPYFHQIPTKST